MQVINLIAAPGVGKSVTGQILSGLLSMAGFNVELVPEFAKFATFSNNQAALSDQIYNFAKQHNRLHVLKNAGLDYAIMDGPLIQQLAYAPAGYFQHYEHLVVEVFHSYDNLNFFLQRNPALRYQTTGRSQTLEQSDRIQQGIAHILERHRIAHAKPLVEPGLPELIVRQLAAAKPVCAPSDSCRLPTVR